MVSDKKEEFLCENCNYPAQNSEEFFDPDTELMIPYCPNCKSRKIIPQKLFNYRISWDMINGKGVGKQIRELGNIFLKLQEYDSPVTSTNFLSIDVPEDVQNEFHEKFHQAQTILRESDLFEALKLFNVRVHINVTVTKTE